MTYNSFVTNSSTIHKQLGKGSFSDVSLVKKYGKLLACKSIKWPLKTKYENLLDEIGILKACSHPNIVKIDHVAMPSFDQINLYLQYIEGATLDKAYLGLKDQQTLFYWIFQLSLAFHYLHKKNIIHRDIKPENIIVNNSGIIKLLDFGLSKITVNHNSDIIGTPYFIAPQIITKKRVYDKSDIWSMGITIYYLLHNKNPFIKNLSDLDTNINDAIGFQNRQVKKKSIEKYFSLVINNDIQYSPNCSPQMRSLLSGMLQKDPKKRLSALEILNHTTMKPRLPSFYEMYCKQACVREYTYDI